jgi:hypothetical protein
MSADADDYEADDDDPSPGEYNNEPKYDPALPPRQVDGAVLLDDVAEFLARFVVYPSGHERHAHALWIAHTWFMGSWESTPRIAFLSPEPGSGKTRALEVTDPLVPRPILAINCTPAYLFRKVSDPLGPPTILYDEIDTVFGPKAQGNEDIRGVINAGHRKGATAGRCITVGKNVATEELPAYCAVALAGLNDLPDTIMTRSIVVRIRRRAPSEAVQPWRPRINGAEAASLYNRLCDWCNNAEPLAEGWPQMPDGVTDRDADVWEALLAIADLAGGHWPKTARDAASAMVASSKQTEPSTGVLLLRDIRRVFDTSGRDKMPTVDILAALNNMDESPWATIRRGDPLDARGLATRLSKYGIKSNSTLRDGAQVFKGYARVWFEDSWSRYLSQESVTPVTSVTPLLSASTLSYNGNVVTGDQLQDRQPVTPKNLLSSNVTDVTDVTDVQAKGNGYTPPTGPDRCADCGWHTPTQGHALSCPANNQGER